MFAGLIIVVVLALVGTGIWALQLERKIVTMQLATHKMMFPNQVRSGRKTYIRNLYRENTIAKWVRRLGLISSIVGGLALAYAIGNQFYSEFGQLPIIGNFYVFPTDYLTERDHALWVLAVAAMIAGVAWSWLAKWLRDALLAANKTTGVQSATDLYWTPDEIIHQRLWLKIALQGLLVVGSVLLLIAVMTGMLPNPGEAWF